MMPVYHRVAEPHPAVCPARIVYRKVAFVTRRIHRCCPFITGVLQAQTPFKPGLLSRLPADFVSLLGLPLQAPIVSDPSNVATCTNRRASKPYCSSAGYVLRDQVGNCGRSRTGMEGHYTLYYLPVGCRPTRVLAQVFGPCLDKETLDERTWRSGVTKETPVWGPVAPTHSAYIPHRTLKFPGPSEVNPVFKLDEDWPRLRVWLKNHNRFGPKRRRRQIQLVTA